MSQQSIIQHIFNGAMNLDDPDFVLPQGYHRTARNIIFRGSKGNMQVENIVGNTEVPNSFLPVTGVNKNIGAWYDAVNKRIFFFNCNTGHHGIYIYNTIAKTFQRLVEVGINTDGDILNFDYDIYITSCDIIYGDGVSGDLLCFLDSLGRPTKINIQRYLANTYPLIERNYIDISKAPFVMPPKCVYENSDLNQSSLNLTVAGDTTMAVVNLNGVVTTGITMSITVNNDASGTTPAVSHTWNFVTVLGNTIGFLLAQISSSFSNYSVIKNSTGLPIFPFSVQDLGGGSVRIYRSNDLLTGNISSSFTFVDASVVSQIKINNTAKKIFQFRTRPVYDDFEKSVWSSASIVPLPNELSILPNPIDTTKNARIAIYIPTGDIDVKKIEVAVRIGENAVSIQDAKWQLLDSLDKDLLSIQNNTVYRYVFYNNSTLTPLDTKDVDLLYSWIPDTANSMCLLNGNTLGIAAITEGYDLVNSNQALIKNIGTAPASTLVYADVNGVLFFGQINGLDSGADGTQITFYLTGTGTNDTNGNPTTLDSVYVTGSTSYMNVNVVSGAIDKSVSVALVASIPTNLSNLSAALIAKGFTQVAVTTNTLIMSYPTSVKLLSSGITLNYAKIDSTIPFYSYLNRANQYFGVQYYTDKGKTGGVTTNASLKIRFPQTSYTGNFGIQAMWAQLQINHRPPLKAKYYQIVRSANLTYSKILFWVGNSAIGNSTAYTSNQYAYIGIDNIAEYNKSVKSTDGVVGYEFAKGDRISIYGRYDSAMVDQTFAGVIYDYEVLGTETNPVLNGVTKIGNYVKIQYPTSDIGANLKFDGNIDYQSYKIILYGIKDTVSPTQTLFSEIGKCFGIGNAGTTNAYHIGLEQTQSADLLTPAIVSIINGDYYFRQRQVLLPTTYDRAFNSINYGNTYATLRIGLTNSDIISTTNYLLDYQPNLAASLASSAYPIHTDHGIFKNLSASNIKIRLQGVIPVSASAVTSFGVYIKIVDAADTATVLNIVNDSQLAVANTGYQIAIDSTFVVPALTTAFFITSNPTAATVYVSAMIMKVSIINQVTIPVYDASYSDVQNILGNSNGRPTAIDINAKRVFFDTRFRFSGSYQLDTNVNQTNRFYPEDMDEWDKSFGAVRRLLVYKRTVNVFQERKVGFINVYGKIITDNLGQQQLITTDKIITPNNIQYYDGNAGIGNQPTAVCLNGYDFYYIDDVTGYIYRKSMNGNNAISEIFKVQTWAGALTKYLSNNAYAYGGNAKLICAVNFLPDRDTEILFMKQGSSAGSITGETLSWVENGNRFPAFYDMNFDNLICAENQLYSFTNGKLYIHNNTTNYANFNGTQFYPSIQVVFNKETAIRKTFNGVHYVSNQVWLSDTNGDIYTSEINEQTGLVQQSSLKLVDYIQRGNFQDANFWRDANSSSNAQEGLVNGDYLQGCYISVNFTYKGVKFVKMFFPYVNYEANNPNF